MLRKFYFLGVTGFFILCALGYGLFRYVHHPIMNYSDSQMIRIEKGMNVKDVLKQLKIQRLITEHQSTLLLVWIKLNRVETAFKAGTYILQGQLTLDQLMQILVKGRVAQFALTIIEGDTFEDLKQNLASHQAIMQTLSDFTDIEIAQKLDIGHANLEGLFFPDTYYFPDKTKDLELLKLAYQTMQNHLKGAWEQRGNTLSIEDPYQALILASIIEKESKFDNERARISGVFHRRLAKNMRLQADPTVKYGLFDGDKKLSREDLKTPHLYNTYVHKGLPPTPIALPGLASIQAALHPDRSELLYFVAKGDGSHYFSETLSEHNKAVKIYQLKQKAGGLLE